MPFDLSSFFTPRFPRRPVQVFSDDELVDLDTRTRLGPELPPNFYDSDWSTDVNTDRLGLTSDPLRDEQLAGIPKYAIEKPTPIKHPSVAQSLAVPLEKATTPLFPDAEKALIDKAQLGGDILGGLADWQVGGSTSPLGLISDYVPIAGPALVKGGAALASKLGAGGIGAAGIPFLKLGKKLGLPEVMGKPVVWRGDPGVDVNYQTAYREINPQYFNREDTLGYMGHAAENKDYAIRDYMYKRGSPYRANQTESHGYQPKARPNLTAVTAPSSKNAVDLTKLPEDPVDVEKLVRGLELWQPHRSAFGERDRLNTRQKAQDLAEEIPYLWRTQQEIDKKLRAGTRLTMREERELTHIGDKMDDIRIPLNDPEITNKLGFDAIRYTDVNQPSWAFPDVSKMETPWGTKLGQKSMGDYKFRVTTPTDYGSHPISGREDIGFFKTRKEAVDAAVKQGWGARVYQGMASGESPITIIPGPKNIDVKKNRIPGLEDYLAQDKEIQRQIGNVQPKKYPSTGEKSLLDGYANKMYGNKYDDLNDWQKWDVNSKLKNDQKSVGVPDDFDELEELADQKYGKSWNQLSDAQKTGIKSIQKSEKFSNKQYIAENMDDDFDIDNPDYYKSSEGEDISNTIKPSNPSTLDASPAEIKKFKNEGVSYNSVAKTFYDEKYADLDDSQQKEVKKFTDWIEKGAPNSSSQPVKSVFDLAKQKYNKPFDELTDTQKMKVWDGLKSLMGKEYSVKMPETMEEALDDLAHQEYDKKTDKYGIGKQYEMKDSMGESLEDVEYPKSGQTEIFKKESLAKAWYGKKWSELTLDQRHNIKEAIATEK